MQQRAPHHCACKRYRASSVHRRSYCFVKIDDVSRLLAAQNDIRLAHEFEHVSIADGARNKWMPCARERFFQNRCCS